MVPAVLGVPNVVAALIAACVVLVVARRRVLGANERTETSWLDAFLKAFVIVVFVVFFTIYLPSYAMQTSTVTDFNRTAQELVGAGIWVVTFSAAVGVLWQAHRGKRV